MKIRRQSCLLHCRFLHKMEAGKFHHPDLEGATNKDHRHTDNSMAWPMPYVLYGKGINESTWHYCHNSWYFWKTFVLAAAYIISFQQSSTIVLREILYSGMLWLWMYLIDTVTSQFDRSLDIDPINYTHETRAIRQTSQNFNVSMSQLITGCGWLDYHYNPDLTTRANKNEYYIHSLQTYEHICNCLALHTKNYAKPAHKISLKIYYKNVKDNISAPSTSQRINMTLV